jgi:hypothetical protein
MYDPFLEAVGVKTEEQAMKDSLRSALGVRRGSKIYARAELKGERRAFRAEFASLIRAESRRYIGAVQPVGCTAGQEKKVLDTFFAEGGRNALCSPGSDGAVKAGGIDPTAGRGAGDQAGSQRQGTDRPVPVSRRPQSQPEYRSGGECVALQVKI